MQRVISTGQRPQCLTGLYMVFSWAGMARWWNVQPPVRRAMLSIISALQRCINTSAVSIPLLMDMMALLLVAFLMIVMRSMIQEDKATGQRLFLTRFCAIVA